MSDLEGAIYLIEGLSMFIAFLLALRFSGNHAAFWVRIAVLAPGFTLISSVFMQRRGIPFTGHDLYSSLSVFMLYVLLVVRYSNYPWYAERRKLFSILRRKFG